MLVSIAGSGAPGVSSAAQRVANDTAVRDEGGRDRERPDRREGDSPRRDEDGPFEADRRGARKKKFSCDFAHSPTDCGFRLQAKTPGRASIAKAGRDGRTGLRLRTEPGDEEIAGSGTMERADVYLSQADTGCYEGREQWWEHSILFPDDFVMPTWQMYVLFDFHHTGRRGQANFHVNFKDGALIFRGYGGRNVDAGEYTALIGPVTKNVWYDFVYHVKWSSRDDGFMEAWVNGVKKLSHRGPTLYAGQGCYLKLANYHTPVCDPYPGCKGPASSVVHGRLTRYDVERSDQD